MTEDKESVGEYEEKLLELVSKAENGNHDFSNLTPLEVLKDIFGHNGFKPQQQEIITRILNKEGHSLGIMPTGGGKSLCFQIPALIQNNLTVVISPLIALMKDQIDNLVKKGTNTAFFVNSSITEGTKEKIIGLVESNKVKLLYLAPESLKSDRILDVLKKVKIDLFVIDEAHCISTWGHNFRPDYLRLPEMIKELNSPQILALTATATKEVEDDIQKQLKIKCKVFKSSFDRPNLFIAVVPLEQNVKKEQFLIKLMDQSLKGPTIIFASYRKTTEKLSDLLKAEGIKSVHYHAGLDREAREKIQNKFITGECDVIVATIAFGMGIDKANIRNIVHYNLPQSIENYYQEIGRAGRDGNISNCVLLFTKSDENKIKSLISSSWPNKQKIKEIISYIGNKGRKYFFTTTRKLFFDCDVKEIPANLILHRLEESGAIRIYTNVLHQIKPLFAKSHIKTIEEVPLKYKKDLENIFSCDFFKSRRSWMSFEEIMDHTNLNYFRVLEIFNYLKDNDTLKFPEIRRQDLIWVREELNNFDIKPLVNLFDSILTHDLEKVELLIKSLTVSGCIRGSILRYFDEPHLKDHCEMCSNCSDDKLTSNIELEIDKNYASDEEIGLMKDLKIDIAKDTLPITLLKSVAIERNISENDFVNILVGDLHHFSSRWKFNLNCYELLDQFKNKKIVLAKILEGLIENGHLKEEVDGALRITKKGINYISKNSSVSENFTTDYNQKDKNDLLDIAHEILEVPLKDHSYIQSSIGELLRDKYDFSVLKEFEVFTKRKGFIDMVGKRKNEVVGIEIDRCVPKHKSIQKLNKLNPTISFFVLTLEINKNKHNELVRRINKLKTPYIVISLYHKKILLQNLSILNEEKNRTHSEPWILGEKNNPDYIKKIIEFTRSDNANERRIAASALGKMAKFKPQIYEAVPSLINLLKDQKPQVRQYAIKSLGLIKDKRAQPHLEIIAENDEKEYNRKSALIVLKKIV